MGVSKQAAERIVSALLESGWRPHAGDASFKRECLADRRRGATAYPLRRRGPGASARPRAAPNSAAVSESM